ncbi:MAG: bifunctional 4-hydroxy-2-oxoglutarate aldolase/2-dehydro-3-deoxy-phosphogluconate aldolase [Flavobacteriales bacterium]|nr:bifunctional 4-hydroxy-2-oxoglutarate aldolase/2-dehydro-3-deoxy-phosphogluconate aldolase [Flavobacteriales bacterium]
MITKEEIFTTMEKTGIVPVFHHTDLDICKEVVNLSYSAGIRVFEFVIRSSGAEKVFEELALYVSDHCPEMILGVGSVVSGVQAEHLIDKGAMFVVTAALRTDVGEACMDLNTMWIPGCGTLTEIVKAEATGCNLVKLFPASVYGPEFIKAVRGPQPWTNIMPTGGVQPNEQNLSDWFKAGATCVGIGSALFDTELINSGQSERLEYNIAQCIRLINTIRA